MSTRGVNVPNGRRTLAASSASTNVYCWKPAYLLSLNHPWNNLVTAQNLSVEERLVQPVTSYTLSPLANFVTSAPICSTTPEMSEPKMAGNFSTNRPYVWIFQSTGLSAVEMTLTRTSFGPGV